MSDTPTRSDLRTTATHVLLSAPDLLDQPVIDLDDEVEHHLRRVLRLRDGEWVSVTDGGGRWRLCVIVGGPRFGLEATSGIATEARQDHFTLAAAIPKGDRVDWMVQKTTELGADRIVLVHAQRSVTRWKAERAERQRMRLQRIADDALRQSRRVWRCVVEGPADAVDVIAAGAVAEPGGGLVSGDESLIAVGPEGGWGNDELDLAASRVSLGPNVLRTETAAIAATTLRMTRHH